MGTVIVKTERIRRTGSEL